MTKKITPHLFKAKSRIGLINKPIRQKSLNSGVELGPDFVINPAFLKKFKNPKTSSFEFPLPENIKDKDFFNILIKSTLQFLNLIDKNLKEDQRQIVIGGDHSVAFSSILSLFKRGIKSEELGYIQFDSHGDMNLYKDSPTKNFHGMYLRAFLDNFDIPEINNLADKKLIAENIIFIGNLDLDKKEEEFFKKMKIKNITRKNILKEKEKILEEFKTFINKFKYLHVSFDIDGMDKSIARATGIPAENGLFLEDVLPFLEIIREHPNFSFDLVEVNPKKEGNKETVELAQTILKFVLREN